jgi:hypothetical protein
MINSLRCQSEQEAKDGRPPVQKFKSLLMNFVGKVPRRNLELQNIRDVIEKKLQAMITINPLMMDYYRHWPNGCTSHMRATFAKFRSASERIGRDGMSRLY